MGCRNRGFSESESAVSSSLGDALLFATICIADLPVDVHIKDGSIYSGIFYTAHVEDEYAIVLKRARMTKKGNRNANIATGSVIETLIILSEDLVQVVVKGVLLPADGFSRNLAGDDVGAVAGTVPSIECTEAAAKTTKSGKFNVDRKQISQTRCSSRLENGVAHGFIPKMASHSGNALEVENGKSDGINLAKKEEASSVSVNGRQVGDGSLQGKQHDYKEKSEFQTEQTRHEVERSSPSSDASNTQLKAVENVLSKMSSQVLPNSVLGDSPAPSNVKLDDQCHERHTSDDILGSDAISSGVSNAVSSNGDVTSESCLSASSTPIDMDPPNRSSSNRNAKEFKLNPGAKIFSPLHQRSATPPAVPTVASVTYIPDSCPLVSIATSQPEVEISPFVPRSSVPVKFFPYANLVAGNGGSDAQYSQPVVGHVASRTQPIRYAVQYHPVQSGPAYVHPNSQNVMVGRLGPLVYVHPVSHDVVQGAAAFSPVSTCPLLPPHQVHLPKYQGSAAAQALQLHATPPFMAAGQQPFTVPSHVPFHNHSSLLSILSRSTDLMVS